MAHSNHSKPIEYWEILERARAIQHTFSDRSLGKAIDYVLQAIKNEKEKPKVI